MLHFLNMCSTILYDELFSFVWIIWVHFVIVYSRVCALDVLESFFFIKNKKFELKEDQLENFGLFLHWPVEFT